MESTISAILGVTKDSGAAVLEAPRAVAPDVRSIRCTRILPPTLFASNTGNRASACTVAHQRRARTFRVAEHATSATWKIRGSKHRVRIVGPSFGGDDVHAFAETPDSHTGPSIAINSARLAIEVMAPTKIVVGGGTIRATS